MTCLFNTLVTQIWKQNLYDAFRLHLFEITRWSVGGNSYQTKPKPCYNLKFLSFLNLGFFLALPNQNKIQKYFGCRGCCLIVTISHKPQFQIFVFIFLCLYLYSHLTKTAPFLSLFDPGKTESMKHIIGLGIKTLLFEFSYSSNQNRNSWKNPNSLSHKLKPKLLYNDTQGALWPDFFLTFWSHALMLPATVRGVEAPWICCGCFCLVVPVWNALSHLDEIVPIPPISTQK